MKNFYNVSSLKVDAFLYALGFEKESYINKSRKENWRLEYSESLQECLDFYYKNTEK